MPRYATIIDGRPVFTDLPNRALSSDGVTDINDFQAASVEVQESAGYFVVEEVALPEPVEGKLWVQHFDLVDGRPTLSWEQRDLTVDELVHRDRFGRQRSLTAKVRTAVNNNLEYLALQNETAADVKTQVRKLTRQVLALQRLLAAGMGESDLLDSEDGT